MTQQRGWVRSGVAGILAATTVALSVVSFAGTASGSQLPSAGTSVAPHSATSGLTGATASIPAATATQTALVSVSPTTQTQPTGSPQTYNIALSCQGAGASPCGPGTTITIPLDTTTTPPMTDPSWAFSATTGSAGLLAGPPTVVGNNLVFAINDAVFTSGYSGSIRLQATPPNNVTPANTSWSMSPTLTGGNIPPATVLTPAHSIATAAPLPITTKATSDGGSVYDAGSAITYNITAKCSTATTGNLFLSDGMLVDQLPPGVTNVTATNGGVYDPVANTVTWSYPNAASTPAGCSAGASGPNAYQVTVTAPNPAPTVEPLTNQVTFTGTGPTVTGGITRSTTAQVPVNIVNAPPTGPGIGYATITKSSLAPIAQGGVTGNNYVGTYPGNWLPSSATPSYTVGAAAGSFQATINYGLVNTYETDVIDPLPCLTSFAGNVYGSAAYNGAACTAPAFHTTVINVSSAGFNPPVNGLGAAVLSGWMPVAILIDGSTVVLAPQSAVAPTATNAYFSIPTPDVGRVASIELPPNTALENKTIQLTMWGYSDPTLAGLHNSVNQLKNTATAIPSITLRSPLAPVQASASIFTVPNTVQLGIAKTFGALGSGPGGTTVVNIKGGVNVPATPLAHPVVLTDLLPLGLLWANHVTSGLFALNQGSGTTTLAVTGAVVDLANYQGSGRELIRITIPASSFATPGAWTITPPTNFLTVTTPTALGIYPNTDQIFLSGLGATPINTSCTTPTQTGGGTSAAVFESADPQDLAGDGILSEDYCQNSASLNVTGTGAAFTLTKTVQGNLDTVPRGALGVGNASASGSGTYGLTWTNVGSDTLNKAVIYDILPFVGDTGVSQGQSGTPRGSQFKTDFTGVGALPAGVTVLYSQSTNPCRPELFTAPEPRCDPQWTATPPSDLSSVAAVEFLSSTSYRSGAGFSVGISVALPAGAVNEVAWNSAATNAADVSDRSTVPLPSEPPKVGLVAPALPTLVTHTAATSPVFSALSDDVVIAGIGGTPGTLAWSLLGPVAPVAGTCSGLSWTNAALLQSGTTAIRADQTATVGPVAPSALGCYSWSETLTGASYGPSGPPAYQLTSAPGAIGEVTAVVPFTPTLSTTATLATASSDGSQSVADLITAAGIPSGALPNGSVLKWTLYGPVAPSSDGSCPTDLAAYTAVSPVIATGDVVVTADGDYPTPDVVLSAPGCYSYANLLPATTLSNEVSQNPGLASETVHTSTPTVTTHTSSAALNPHQSVRDTVKIGGTGGAGAFLAWSLVGPVAPIANSCADVDWAAAAVVASATSATTGDATVTTGPVSVKGIGCYSWTDTLTRTAQNGFPSPLTLEAGGANEVIFVTPFQPTLSSIATLIAAPAGGYPSVSDAIAIAGTGASTANPLLSTLKWDLLGPLPTQMGSCSALNWTAAPIVNSGNISVTGDGTYKTPGTALTSTGCYTYNEQLSPTSQSDPALVPSGSPDTTVLVEATSSAGSDSGTAATNPVLLSPALAAPALATTGLAAIRLIRWAALLLLAGVGLVVLSRRYRLGGPTDAGRPGTS